MIRRVIITGRRIISNSATEKGIRLVAYANITLAVPLIYLLKNAANEGLCLAIIKMIPDKSASPNRIYAASGIFSLAFLGE